MTDDEIRAASTFEILQEIARRGLSVPGSIETKRQALLADNVSTDA